MSDSIVPIRDGVKPQLDVEREIVEYCMGQVKKFTTDAKVPPTRVMLALAGNGKDGELHTIANSWDVENRVSRIENCGLAVMLFTDRALK